MKHLFLALGAMVLVLTGAGCAASNVVSVITGNDGVIEGKWKLVFDLPEGWVQVEGYAQPNKEVPTLSQDVNHTMGMITLQSTSKPIARTTTPAESIPKDAYVTTDYTKIDVDFLDPRRSIPKDATDLGNGFFRASPVANDCTPGSCTTTYYLKTVDNVKYMFTVWQVDQEPAVAEKVILSAKPVARFTDTVPAGSAGDVKTAE